MTVTEHDPDAQAGPEGPDGADGADGADGPDAPDAPGGSKRRRNLVAGAVSVFGELLITTGVLLALFVTYSLYWTNVQANRQADRLSDDLRDGWDKPVSVDLKDGIGFLHVPSMARNVLVKKGTNTDDLNNGIAGYYTKPVKSTLPWDGQGNFSLAAHRDGHGAKFHNIHKVKTGDAVVFETKNTWYIYKVFRTLPKTSKYNTGVLNDIPKGSGKKTADRYITLTTCTPIFTSNYRYIVWGELVRTEQVDDRRTPPRELRD